MPRATPESPIQLAVITGQHPYDVIGFHQLFRNLSGVEWYMQHMEAYATTPRARREQYNVALFYHMHQEIPAQKPAWYEQGSYEAIERLGETDQGIFILHHALAAYPNWPLWDQIIGIEHRNTQTFVDQRVRVRVANGAHAITRGLSDWDMCDETYTMADPAEGSEILLTTDAPKSMKTIAWTRQHGQARVFCLQSGHDAQAFTNPGFQAVIARGVAWCARRI